MIVFYNFFIIIFIILIITIIIIITTINIIIVSVMYAKHCFDVPKKGISFLNEGGGRGGFCKFGQCPKVNGFFLRMSSQTGSTQRKSTSKYHSTLNQKTSYNTFYTTPITAIRFENQAD